MEVQRLTGEVELKKGRMEAEERHKTERKTKRKKKGGEGSGSR